MKNETYEEFFTRYLLELKNASGRSLGGMPLSSKVMGEYAWNTQQKKIDLLESKINKVMDAFEDNYKCPCDSIVACHDLHGCTDCQNIGFILNCPLSAEIYLQFIRKTDDD